MPTSSPAATSEPFFTVGRTGSYVVRSGGSPVPSSSTETTPRPATLPANDTRPGATARTAAPGGAARSTPRWPAPYVVEGGSQARRTGGRVPTGQFLATGGGGDAGAGAGAGAGSGVGVRAVASSAASVVRSSSRRM